MPHFGLNQVLLFLILDVGTQVNKQYFFFRFVMKMLHSTLTSCGRGLVLQTRTWKWTAVIVFAISCISNSSSNSNNSSNNVIIAINNSSGINNSALQRKKGTDIRQKSWEMKVGGGTGVLNAARQTIGWKNTSSHCLLLKKGSSNCHQSMFTPVYYLIKLVFSSSSITSLFQVPSLPKTKTKNPPSLWHR